jgi:hypothetical protein
MTRFMMMYKADGIERATRIKAPPEKIFPLINDFRSWGYWSAYEKLDPMMKRTHCGPANGNGAVYEWEGNHKAGQGWMEIMDSYPPSTIAIKLDFIKPFEGHKVAEFTLESRGDSTNVTWAMYPYFSGRDAAKLDAVADAHPESEVRLASVDDPARRLIVRLPAPARL